LMTSDPALVSGSYRLLITPAHARAGLRYKPTMASNFSAKLGSLLILKVSTRCGLSPCVRQIRRTLASLMPVSLAMVRVDQWVALAGLVRVVLAITVSMSAAEIDGLRPGRCASFRRPATPVCTKQAPPQGP